VSRYILKQKDRLPPKQAPSILRHIITGGGTGRLVLHDEAGVVHLIDGPRWWKAALGWHGYCRGAGSRHISGNALNTSKTAVL
jgi:hypothetical protein